MKIKALLAILLLVVGCGQASMELTEFPEVREKASKGTFPLAAAEAATICVDNSDARVVSIAAAHLLKSSPSTPETSPPSGAGMSSRKSG